MKRLCLMLFALLLVVGGCGQKNTLPAPHELANTVLESLQGGTFRASDADYVENSFAFSEAPTDHALYLGEEFGLEFGIFRFSTNAAARAGAREIHAYLAREEQAVRDLSALYPAAELSARLDRYAGAAVRTKGNTVAYFLLSETDRSAAEQAFARATRG
ncbi:MAG: hypothetical protein IJC99_05185 [Clostridia bacterium]|nr:hypothetical protein [Clostridia bacterium]